MTSTNHAFTTGDSLSTEPTLADIANTAALIESALTESCENLRRCLAILRPDIVELGQELREVPRGALNELASTQREIEHRLGYLVMLVSTLESFIGQYAPPQPLAK